MSCLALAMRVVATNAVQHKDDKRRPDFHMLAEEMLELSLALRGQHEHPPWLELTGIGGIAINWISDIAAANPDDNVAIIEYHRKMAKR